MSYRRLDAAEARLKRMKLPAQNDVDFGRWRDDPMGFVEQVLGGESAHRRSDWSVYQFEVLCDVNNYPRTAVISGHGVGKTTIIAWLVIWWLVTRPMSRVVLVAPQFDRQVRGVNFAEIRRWVRRAKIPLPLEVQSGRVLVNGYGSEWSASGVPATEPDRIEGVHADHVLLICDETKGIPQAVYDALQGMLSGHGDTRLVVCSTPGGVQGPFWRIITRGHELGWKVHHVNSEDSSNVNPEWCRQRAAEWGRGSPLYETRVLGKFSDAGDGILFPLSMLEAAINREVPASEDTVMGVDVARSLNGDANCVSLCRGGRVTIPPLWREPDAMKTVARVAHLVAQTGPKRVRVDETGIGAGVVDRLRQMGYAVEGVNFGSAANDPKRFKNKRCELYWSLREGLEQGKVSLPDDEDLVADLSALRFDFDAAGRIVLESKDDVRRRLGRSPDRADALVLSVPVTGRLVQQWTRVRAAH
jgi:phage terminase large subunit-like protein